MSNRILLGVAVLIVAIVALGVVFALRPAATPTPAAAPQTSDQTNGNSSNNSSNSPSATAPASAVEVDLTDQGFSPATVTIKKGQAVHFVNKSSNQMWIASNPHPVHTDYPGFDELQAADTYDFTFNNAGTWGYHDHLSPTTKGTVVVTQ